MRPATCDLRPQPTAGPASASQPLSRFLVAPHQISALPYYYGTTSLAWPTFPLGLPLRLLICPWSSTLMRMHRAASRPQLAPQQTSRAVEKSAANSPHHHCRRRDCPLIVTCPPAHRQPDSRPRPPASPRPSTISNSNHPWTAHPACRGLTQGTLRPPATGHWIFSAASARDSIRPCFFISSQRITAPPLQPWPAHSTSTAYQNIHLVASQH